MRRPVFLLYALFVFEASTYATIAPLLPHYSRELGLSKTGAGVLAGAFGAGLVLGAMLVGALKSSSAARTIVAIGLVLIGACSVVFGFGLTVAWLDFARCGQGIGAGMIWTGSMAWLTSMAPPDRRGHLMGMAWAATTFGTILGPGLGTLAVILGPRLVFGFLGLIASALILWVSQTPAATATVCGTPRLLAVWRHRETAPLLALIAMLMLSLGAITSLIPLRLARTGATSIGVGVTFILAAVVGTLSSTLAGRISDHRDPQAPLQVGLLLAVPCLVLFPLLRSPVPLASLTVLYVGAVFRFSIVPTTTLLADAGERAGLATGVPAGTMIALAIALTIETVSGGSLAQATSDLVPFVFLAILTLSALCHLAMSSRYSLQESLAPRWRGGDLARRGDRDNL